MLTTAAQALEKPLSTNAKDQTEKHEPSAIPLTNEHGSQLVNKKKVLSLADIKPFSASYRAKIKGIEIAAERTLTKNTNGLFQLKIQSKGMFLRLKEESSFSISDAYDQIKADQYSYNHSIFGSKRSRQIEVNRQNKLITYRDKKKSVDDIAYVENILDPLSYQLQIRLDLMAHDGEIDMLSYQVLDKGRVRTFEFRKLGEETIDTALGRINTVVIERYRNSKKKRTTIWLAKDWDYMLVKLRHEKDGKTSDEMTISKGQIGGKAISGN